MTQENYQIQCLQTVLHSRFMLLSCGLCDSEAWNMIHNNMFHNNLLLSLLRILP